MVKARDVMTKNVATISPEAPLKDAITMLIDKQISGMPVVDKNGTVIGVLSEKDIMNYMFSGNLSIATVEEAMSKVVASMPSDTDLDRVALVIFEKKIRRVPIIDNGKLVGIISRRDIIRSMLKEN